MKNRIFVLFFLLGAFTLFAQNFGEEKNLAITGNDVVVVQDPKGGYHLYVRAKSNIKSVLLTETTRDPALKLANYSYRDPNYNEVNGNEKRLLNGKFLPKEKKLYSLIDSTPEENTPIGRAFHIWIPYIVVYGYEWSRSGEVEVQDGTFFNIRSFAEPYGDYTGGFKDNPFLLRVTQKPFEEAKTEATKKAKKGKKTYSKIAVKSFTELADLTEGKIHYAKNPDEIIPTIKKILNKDKKENLDLLLALDSTESMKDDIKTLRKDIIKMLTEIMPQYKSCRVSLILYKDYREDFLVREACVFTSNLKKFKKALFSFEVVGGRDIPEAVYEGLHLGLLQSWRSEDDSVERKLILLGDAPPHSRPRGKITKAKVDKLALKKKVEIYPIIMPHGLSY